MRYITLHYNYNYNHNYTTLIALHYATLHYTLIASHYTTLHYTTLPYPTLHYITLHYTTLITPPQMHLQLHYANYTTPQLQLHYTTATTTAALHHTTSSSCGWGDRRGDHCNHCSHSKKHSSNHLSVHQWIRSAIRDSQHTTTNLSYRFPIFETSATALCGTTGSILYMIAYYFWFTIYTLYNIYIDKMQYAMYIYDSKYRVTVNIWGILYSRYYALYMVYNI